ncbi:MAG: energy transducer TonB [Flavobacteriales bacterium]|nr:energy transducer TonB [Flavobacteriales bacterium]
MWSWTTRLTDRIIALIDGGDFFRRPWRTGYAVIAVLLAIAGIVWAVALVSVGLYGLVRLYIEQHYVIAVQGWPTSSGSWASRPVCSSASSGSWPIPCSCRHGTCLDAVPLLNVLSGLFSFDWTWPVITAPIGGFLIILFSRWLGDSMEVLFAIANNTKHVAIGAGQRPLEAAAAEPRLFTWEGALLGLLFYLVLALPLHGHLVTCPALGLLAYGLVKGLRTASLVWVGVSVILLLRGLMALIALVDERSVALVYLERESVLLIFLFILVCAGLVLTVNERTGRVCPLTTAQVWVFGTALALLYALHPLAGMMIEAGGRHEPPASNINRSDRCSTRTRAADSASGTTTGWIPSPRSPYLHRNTRRTPMEPIHVTHELYLANRKLRAEFMLLHQSIALPDSLVYRTGGDRIAISYLTDSIHFDGRGGSWGRQATAVALDAYARSMESARQSRAEALRALRDSLEAQLDTLVGQFTSYDCSTGRCFAWFNVEGPSGTMKRSFHCPSELIDGYPIKALPVDGEGWRLVVRKTISTGEGDPTTGRIAFMDELVGIQPLVRSALVTPEDPVRTIAPIESRPITQATVKVEPGYRVYTEQEVDVAPEFPGGRSGLKAYLASRAYPQTERNAGHVAKVRVRFVVGSDGVPTNVKVLSSGYPGFDAEALRLVKAMPKWTPGKVNGSPVPVSTMVTVDFSLNE